MVGVACRRLRDHLLRRAGRGQLNATGPARAGQTDDPSAGLPDRELVRGAMGTLVPAQREIVELAFFGGMTHTEIAARLSQPLGTVKTRMRSALKHMREQLARTAAEPVT